MENQEFLKHSTKDGRYRTKERLMMVSGLHDNQRGLKVINILLDILKAIDLIYPVK